MSASAISTPFRRTSARVAKKAKAAAATTTRRKKATATATGSRTTKTKSRKGSGSKAASRPTWKDMIRECIAENKDDARVGVSRSLIKKFAEERYGVQMNSLNSFQLGRAIMTGTESGIFVLPKGPSGKVKLARKSVSKENSEPQTSKKNKKKVNDWNVFW